MLLDPAEKTRQAVSPTISPTKKSLLGQFMTPAPVARFMAAMFPPSQAGTCRLLDAGAGLGALTSAFIDRWRSGGFGFERLASTACELDDGLRMHLTQNLARFDEVSGHHLERETGAIIKPGQVLRQRHSKPVIQLAGS